MIGSTYLNKHNGKTIEIEDKIVTDTGTILYYGVDTSNGHGDYYTIKNLREHWIGNDVAGTTTYYGKTPSEIEEEQMAINSNFYRWVCENHPSVAAEFHEVMKDA